ncbi:MAG TPA: transglutaminase family protein [Candidatus Didemnitutus sp.]|jgi:transglutaminase-like putative cysteine protease
MKLHVFHRTRYAYASPVRESFNEARLQPVTGALQTCEAFRLTIVPDCQVFHYPDYYFNSVHQFDLTSLHKELVVEAHSDVVTKDDPGITAGARSAPLGELGPLGQVERCYDFLQSSTYVESGPAIAALAQRVVGAETDCWQAAQAISAHIHNEFKYQPASTNSRTHMREVLETQTGVCQDFAHVMLGYCRSLNLPARYVSGYLYNGPADGLKGAQASHAWVEVYVPGRGWFGLDPTNGKIAAGNHVKVAVGRDYSDVPPVKGTYRGTGRRSMTVEVLVTLAEQPAAARA